MLQKSEPATPGSGPRRPLPPGLTVRGLLELVSGSPQALRGSQVGGCRLQQHVFLGGHLLQQESEVGPDLLVRLESLARAENGRGERLSGPQLQGGQARPGSACPHSPLGDAGGRPHAQRPGGRSCTARVTDAALCAALLDLAKKQQLLFHLHLLVH